jgi:dephospho-CoA kinase
VTVPFRLGLTGSIGMGKSTTAEMFADEGVPVWDADAAVHRLYAPGGAAIGPVRNLCPDCIADGAVDRTALKAWLGVDKGRLAQLEAVVHPLVAADRRDFLEKTDAPIVLLDIPLLYETKADAGCDAVVVVSAPEDIQRARVLARPGMTEAHLEAIRTRQMPDAKKRARADFVIETTTLEAARRQVQNVLETIRSRLDA